VEKIIKIYKMEYSAIHNKLIISQDELRQASLGFMYAMKKYRQSAGLPIGKRVRRMGEEGTIVIDSFDGEEPEYFIMFKENDMEQLLGLPFEIWDDNKGKFVEDSNDINPFFELTDEEKDFLNLKDGFVSSI
jgi:hypothetical protein